jgi:hypothetical protein
LEGLLAELRSVITTAATPRDLPDDVLLAWFSSKLSSIRLELRSAVAPPALFRLFTEILATIPPPVLVDAICLAMESTLYQQPYQVSGPSAGVPGEMLASYVKEVCTPALGKALCDLTALGAEYASPDLLRMLRYFVDSDEFKTLSSRDSSKLVRLCHADEAGDVRRAAQELHAQHLLDDYSALPFPKPAFPLGEECLQPSSHHFTHFHAPQVLHWNLAVWSGLMELRYRILDHSMLVK